MPKQKCKKKTTILIAEDNEEERNLIKQAADEGCICNELKFVNDGQDLFDYLHRRGDYRDSSVSPCPDLIVLNPALRNKSGIELLRELKSDPNLKTIPIIVFSTLEHKELVNESYGVGANTYIAKPRLFDGVVKTVSSFLKYWCEIAKLPKGTCPGFEAA